MKSVVRLTTKVHPTLLNLSNDLEKGRVHRLDLRPSANPPPDAVTQENTEDPDASEMSSSSTKDRKSSKFGKAHDDLREKIVQEVLDQILPDLGAYAVDGSTSNTSGAKSAIHRWLQFFGCLTLDLHDAVLTGYLSQVQYSIRKLTTGERAQPERINEYNSEGRTALSLAAKIDNMEMVQELLQAHALCDMIDEATGRTPLYYSVQNRNHAMSKLLLSHGASANTVDFQCVTPLMIACTTNDYKHVQMLCDSNADVDLQDERGWSALHYATINNAEKCVAALLREGADRDLRDINKRKPIHFAKFKDFGNCIAILSSRGTIAF